LYYDGSSLGHIAPLPLDADFPVGLGAFDAEQL
jgi:hypothetical protein